MRNEEFEEEKAETDKFKKVAKMGVGGGGR